MSIVGKIYLTLAVLFPFSLGVLLADKGGRVISSLAITELSCFGVMTLGVVIAGIWRS